MAKKVTKKELESIKEANTELQKVVLLIGNIELEKQNLINKSRVEQQKLDKLKLELQEKYGDVIIDINTGEIKKEDG